WRSLLDLFIDQANWKQAEAVASDELASVSLGSLQDRADAVFDHAIVPVTKLRHTLLTTTEKEEALARFEAFKKTKQYLPAYHKYRSEVFESMDQSHNAASEYLQAAKLRPDDADLGWTLVTRYTPELGQGTTLAHLNHVIDRDPFNGEKMAKLVHVHTMWY